MALDPGIEALRREFREEAEEHLRVLDDDLLLIEKSVRGGSVCPQPVLEEMFRSTHTIKGLSAMFELDFLRELAHDLESVFDRLRKGTLEAGDACLDVLFSAVDGLRDAVAHMDEGTSGEKGRTASTRLKAFLGETSDTGGAETPAVSGAYGEYASRRLAEAAGEGLTPVLLRLRWGIELRLGAYSVADLESMMGRCEVLEVTPLISELPHIGEMDFATQDVEFEVLALTDRPAAEIADSIGTDPGRVRPVSLPAAAPAEAAPSSTGEATTAPAAGVRAGSTGFVRVDLERLDEIVNMAGELVTAKTRLVEVEAAARQVLGKHEEIIALASAVKELSTLVNGLQEGVMALRMVPVQQLFGKLPRVVRDIARARGKEIEFVSEGGDTELDKRLIEQIEDPLIHMVRNACDHGIESPAERIDAGKPAVGMVRVRSYQEGTHVVVEVTDDGAGLDVAKIRERALESGMQIAENPSAELLAEIIMAPGFTTATTVTDVSGRGVGLDVVRRRLMDMGGHVEVDTTPGTGTTFRIRTPVTLAITSALLVRLGDRTLAIPLSAVTEALRIRTDEVRRVKTLPVLDVRGETLPLVELHTVLNMKRDESHELHRRFVVVVGVGGNRFGLVVDGLVGQQEIVVKSVEESLGSVPGVSGATILGDGGVVPILDVEAIGRLTKKERESVSSVRQEVGADA